MSASVSTRTTAGWLERANRAFPGGVLATFRLPDGLEFVVDHARGAALYATDGRRFVDYVLGSGPLILGHAHPLVTRAIAEQAERGTTYFTTNESAIQLAEEVLSVFPPAASLMFTTSGSEATFYAMRLARAFTGRQRVLKFAGAYHGNNDYAMIEAFPRKRETQATPATAGVPDATSETVVVADFNDRPSVERAFARHGPELAAVIVEPYQRVLEPEEGFLQFLRSIATDHGTLLIADEIVTGFRFYYGMAQQLYGIAADITTVGKIIGGGLPVAAVVGREDIMALADSRSQGSEGYVYLSGTLNGHALGAAAGLATLEILKEPGAYERLNQLGKHLRAGLRGVADKYDRPALVVGRGPMFHILFTSAGSVTRASDIVAADRAAGVRFGRSLIKQGILVNPRQRSYVSLAHTDSEIAETLLAFDGAFADVVGGRD